MLSCSKETPKGHTPEEVTFSLGYSFAESGSMTKSGSQAYDDFYGKYIKTKELAPKTFVLTFTNKETGATATVRGDWAKNHSFKLLAGEYEVTGTSHPSTSKCLDSLYLCFNENIIISNETQSINLTAQYDSYLLMFDKGDKNSVKYRYWPASPANTTELIDLNVVDEIYYAFFYELIGSRPDNAIVINRNGVVSTITMDDMPFEKGKYYYFNDLSNSFDIPPMGNGNQDA